MTCSFTCSSFVLVPKYCFVIAPQDSRLAKLWPEAIGGYQLREGATKGRDGREGTAKDYPYYRKFDGKIRTRVGDDGTVHKVV